MENYIVDTNYDFRTDAGGKDPDQYSPTLRKYHQLLWSKSLPSGKMFTLDDTSPIFYLQHKSALGSFYLSSDSVIPTFTKWKRLQHIIERLPSDEVESFLHLAYTMGGMLIFPSNKVDGEPSINMERGFNPLIADRLDLTLECIRRYYLGEDSPMFETLKRYNNFFELFGDFRGYVDFFLLNDLVSDDYSSIKFVLPFDNFKSISYPQDINEYKSYREATIAFLEKRNKRIEVYTLNK